MIVWAGLTGLGLALLVLPAPVPAGEDGDDRAAS